MTAAGPPRTRIGVEVHVQLRTATKMFCGCPAAFGGEPNSRVCPVCLGLPGALPVPNARAVDLALRAAHALGCTVARRSRFDRKHYFYPDLPRGYQITQHRRPLARDGRLRVPLEEGVREVGIRRLHLEEDAGKSVHDRFPGSTAVDLNRAGVPLVEIVTEPDLRTPGETRAFLTRLRRLLEHFAAVSDCNMEEGSLRVDANLSVVPRGDAAGDDGGGRTEQGTRTGGARTEVKNLNSFRHVEKALAYERDRRRRLLEAGEPGEHETRAWDASAGETRVLRGKEEAFDYRYFPDPDLPPLELAESRIEAARDELPELPLELERRLAGRYGLPGLHAERIAATPERAAFFEAAARGRDAPFARQVANLLLGPVAEARNRRGGEARTADLLAPAALARVAELRLDGTLSSTTADEAVRLLVEGEDRDPDRLVEERGLAQVRDVERLEAWVEEAVAGHPEEARRYARGEEKLLGFFMGVVMRRAGGRADPGEARRLLEARLEEVEVG